MKRSKGNEIFVPLIARKKSLRAIYTAKVS
nr:MAG TPA: hypothetical protein [Caudoviricetes sp.]